MVKKSIEAMVLCIAISTVLVSALISPTLSESKIKVYLDPPSITVKPGDNFTIVMRIDPDGHRIREGKFNLTFDPNIFVITSISPGDLISSILTHESSYIIKEVKNDMGTLKYAFSTPIPISSGSLAIIKFKTLAKANLGNYQVLLAHIKLINQNFEDIAPIEISLENSSITIANTSQTLTTFMTSTKTIVTKTTIIKTITISMPINKHEFYVFVPVTTNSTVTQTEALTTTKVETVTVSTTLPASTVTVKIPSPSYIGVGLLLGIIIGIVAAYIILSRK